MTLLTRWEPFRDLATMQDRMNRMNRLFREAYSPEGPEEALTTVSADLKGSHCGRFGCEPEMSAVRAGDTGALTAS
jgi:hypothetical protein